MPLPSQLLYRCSMSIYIDGRAACRAQRTGKGQWVLRTVEALLRCTQATILLDNRPVPSEWRSPGVTVRHLAPGLAWHLAAASMLLRERSSVYLAPSSFIVPAMIGRWVPCVPVVHDLIAFRSDPHEAKARLIERWTLARALRNAAHVCATSDATKRDLLERFPFVAPVRVTSVYAGASVVPHSRVQIRETRNSERGTILCPGTLCPRKNQLRLIKAYADLPKALCQRFTLLLTGGRGWQDSDILSAVRSTPGVEWRGYVPEREYAALLAESTILAFPSLYEGFGLPVLDALGAGVPVLTSDRGSLPEIAADCAVIVHPESVEDIRRGLTALLTNPELRAELARKGQERASRYSWVRTAELIVGVLQGVAAR
jgi:glycosyltransferase involved in cell wall biosynthesis